MTSMDLETIIRDLNKRFAAPLPEFYKRRIIFWYDEGREFEDKLEDIEITNASCGHGGDLRNHRHAARQHCPDDHPKCKEFLHLI